MIVVGTLKKVKVRHGLSVPIEDNVVKVSKFFNYEFLGWVDLDGNIVDLKTRKITEDTMFIAKYAKKLKEEAILELGQKYRCDFFVNDKLFSTQIIDENGFIKEISAPDMVLIIL